MPAINVQKSHVSHSWSVILLSLAFTLLLGCGGSSTPPGDMDAAAMDAAITEDAAPPLALPSSAGLTSGAARVSSPRYRGHISVGGPAPAGFVTSPAHAGGIGLGLQEVLR